MVADGLNSLFLRNCVSYGLQAFSCPGVSRAFVEGDIADVDVDGGLVVNQRTGATRQGERIPPHLLAIMRGGGLPLTLESMGLISPPHSVSEA